MSYGHGLLVFVYVRKQIYLIFSSIFIFVSLYFYFYWLLQWEFFIKGLQIWIEKYTLGIIWPSHDMSVTKFSHDS